MDWGRKDRIAQKAAQWVVLVDSDAFDPAAAAKLQRWLAASPEHAEAFQFASRIWDDLDVLEKLKAYPQISAALTASLQAGAPTSHAGAATNSANRRGLILGASAAAGAGVLVCLVGYSVLGPGSARAYETQVGEQREIPLPDGTRVLMNASTRIETHIGRGRRQVRLLEGEAFFIIAGNQPSPFLIETSAGGVGAAAGEVLVKLLPDGVRIVLFSAAALAQARGASPDSAPFEVSAGSEIVLAREAVAVEQRPREHLQQRLSWREGMLTFQDTPLAEAAADMTRQTGVQFVFDDPELGALRVAGRVAANDLHAFLDLLHQNLELETERRGDQIIVRAKSDL